LALVSTLGEAKMGKCKTRLKDKKPYAYCTKFGGQANSKVMASFKARLLNWAIFSPRTNEDGSPFRAFVDLAIVEDQAWDTLGSDATCEEVKEKAS
jgi:hypothetical protein